MVGCEEVRRVVQGKDDRHESSGGRQDISPRVVPCRSGYDGISVRGDRGRPGADLDAATC